MSEYLFMTLASLLLYGKTVKMFFSMGNIESIYGQLVRLGLSSDEATIFMSLLKQPATPLQVSRETNIARSSVYRLVDGLMARGLIHELATEDDKLLQAADPASLEVLVVDAEHAAQQRRTDFESFVQMASNLHSDVEGMSVKTYHGEAGIKQMLWNELKTKTEICIFSPGSLNDALGKVFSEKYRNEIIQRGIMQRSLRNDDNPTFVATDLSDYKKHLETRFINLTVFRIHPEITIHDDTVSIYTNWASKERVGTEITNPFLAAFMRQIFEYFWAIAKPLEDN